MKLKPLTVMTWLVLAGISLPSAFANHRTGSLILPELIVSGDFNQDGKLDLAVNASGFDNVAILLGNGAGGFTLAGHFASDTLPKGLQVGDINRDGHLDLATCNSWGYNETVLLGDGRGSFHTVAPPTEVDGDGEPVRFLLRDFNNDGLLDMAVNAPDNDAILLYFGDGRGNFPAPAIEVQDVQQPFAMASADLNRDGNLDIVVGSVSKTSSKVTILLGDGRGHFTSSALPVGSLPSSVQIGDINNDGNLDFVVAGALSKNQTGNYISTFIGNGTGQFTAHQTLALGQGNLKGDIALGDFDEDGKLDVAFPKTGLQDGSHTASTKLLLFFGDGTGNLIAGPILTVGQEPHTVIAVDLNQDGHLDLAVSNRTDGTVSCLLGDGHGNFAVSSTTSILSPVP